MSYDKNGLGYHLWPDGSFRDIPPERSESNAKPRSGGTGIPVRVLDDLASPGLSGPRTLLIDIENTPNLAYVWDVWNQNINPKMLVETQQILCFAYKLMGNKPDRVFCSSQFYDGMEGMLERLWKLLDWADIVVDYNGSRHDILHINTALLKAGFTPPSPYQHIDLWKTIKRKFNFTYMSLDHVCKELGLTAKLEDGGFDTWLGCMRGDKASWDKMVEYNKGDIPPLEELYLRLRPWISPHPNLSLFSGKRQCPVCQSSNIQLRGWKYTTAGKFRQVYCSACGSWSRLAKRESTTDIRNAAD